MIFKSKSLYLLFLVVGLIILITGCSVLKTALHHDYDVKTYGETNENKDYVIVFHGIYGKFEDMNMIAESLSKEGYNVISVQYPTNSDNIEEITEKYIKPVVDGLDKDIKVNVRVVAATNKDLKKEIEEGRFREDLYHRLAVILIKVPALNDRRDDIPELIEYFASKIASEQGNAVKSFSKSAIKLLQEYDWTGNIRELRNVVERLIILGGNEISEQDVQLFASK